MFVFNCFINTIIIDLDEINYIKIYKNIYTRIFDFTIIEYQIKSEIKYIYLPDIIEFNLSYSDKSSENVIYERLLKKVLYVN